MAWKIYDATGIQKANVLAVPATGISGIVSPAHGGTGQDLSASSGDIVIASGVVSANTKTGTGDSVRASAPTLVSPVVNTGISGSAIDSDSTFAANSDTLLATQKAVKTALALKANLAGGNIFTGAQDLNGATMRAPVTASALTATEGYWKWDSTHKLMKFHDGTRERGASGWGYQPYAQPASYSSTQAAATALALDANGGSLVVPIYLNGHMLLDSVELRNTDATLARWWTWALFVDRNNASANANLVAQGGEEKFTAAAASNRRNAPLSATYLPPGSYFLLIYNTHATNSFGVGYTAGGNAAMGVAQAKYQGYTAPGASTLDLTAVGWTDSYGAFAVQLRGTVGADSVAW